MITLGFSLGILTPLSQMMVLRTVGENRAGSAMGATESIFGAGWTISPFIAGAMAQSILGPESPYLMLGVLSVTVLVAATWTRLRSMRITHTSHQVLNEVRDTKT